MAPRGAEGGGYLVRVAQPPSGGRLALVDPLPEGSPRPECKSPSPMAPRVAPVWHPCGGTGSLFIGDAGPEEAVGSLGFFVVRPSITPDAVTWCDALEVLHVRTDWLGGEVGVSWFFHAVCGASRAAPHAS